MLLKDDKNLQPADNVTPVLNNKITDAYGADAHDLVNTVSAKITTEVLTDLNKQTDIDQKDPDAVAKALAQDERPDPGDAVRPRRSGPTIVVGSANFTEDETLADIYADVLKANGYPVSKKLKHRQPRDLRPGVEERRDLVHPRLRRLAAHVPRPEEGGHDEPRHQRDGARGRRCAPLKLTAFDVVARAGHQRLRRHQGDRRQVRPREPVGSRQAAGLVGTPGTTCGFGMPSRAMSDIARLMPTVGAATTAALPDSYLDVTCSPTASRCVRAPRGRAFGYQYDRRGDRQRARRLRAHDRFERGPVIEARHPLHVAVRGASGPASERG